MTFLQLQQELAALHLDTSAVWIAGGASNKLAINKGYEELYDMVKNSEKVKKKICANKSAITITDFVGNLPATCDTVDYVSTVPFTTDPEYDIMNSSRYYDWKVTGTGTTKKLVTNGAYTTLYVAFLPIRTDMTTDSSEPTLPTELHRSIVNFALVEYYRMIRDDLGASNALVYAQQVLQNKLSRLG